MGVASAIYKGSASYGRFIAIISAIIATLIGIALIVMGVNHNISVSKRSYTANATVISKNCSNSSSNSSSNNSNLCEYTINYKDENGNMNNATFSTTNEYLLNSIIPISYGENKSDVMPSKDNKKSTGYGMMVFGIILTLLAWGWVWVTRTYEFAASASGISSAFDFFKR
jgi:hypothetical protein